MLKKPFYIYNILFDVVSAAINSLDYMGYNISSKIVDTITGPCDAISVNINSCSTNVPDFGSNDTQVQYRVGEIGGYLVW